MRIVFVGRNPAAFLPGFAEMAGRRHEIVAVPDNGLSAAEREAFCTADVLVGIKLDAAMPRPEKLRLFHAPAAGTDGVDRALLPPGVPLCCCFGHEQPIAEYVMAALLARHVPLAAADRELRQGNWAYWPGRDGTVRTELGDGTIGLLGFGHIGKAVAARAKAFGMKVHVCNRSPVAACELVDRTWTLDRLPEFMGSADAIVVSLPLAEATRGIVDATALGAMRNTAVIVNVGRGPVIDEDALYDALAAKRIAGAIIDTWYVYPGPDAPRPQPSRWPLHALDNIVMTPHMSGWTHGTIRRRQQTMADNIGRLERGEPLINVVHRG